MSEHTHGRLTEYHALSYTGYDDGTFSISHLRLDPASKRMTTESLGCYEYQDGNELFPTEILELALREWQARLQEDLNIRPRKLGIDTGDGQMRLF